MSKTIHQVDATLLDLARARGLADETVRNGVINQLQALRTAGVDTVVCTCSTLGDFAECSAALIGLTVKRVDRADGGPGGRHR